MPHLKSSHALCRKATGDLVCSLGGSAPDAGVRLQGRDILDVRAGCSAFPVKSSSEHDDSLSPSCHTVCSTCVCLNKSCVAEDISDMIT